MDFQRVQHHSSSIQVPSSKIQVPFKFLSSSIQTRCVSVSPGPPRPSGPLRLALLRSVPRRRCAAAVSTAFASLCRRYGPAGARSGRGLCAARRPLTSLQRYAAHIRARLRPACRRRARGPPGRCAPPGGPPRLRWRAAFAPLRAPPLRPVGARRGPSLGRGSLRSGFVPRRRCASPSRRVVAPRSSLRRARAWCCRRSVLRSAAPCGASRLALAPPSPGAVRRLSPPPCVAPRRATFGGFLAPPQGRRGPPSGPPTDTKKSGVSPTPD